MNNSRLIVALLAASMAAGCTSEPKITGTEATRVLEQCIMADAMVVMDNEQRQMSGNADFTPQMVAHLEDAISVCRLVGRIDRSQVTVPVRPCLDVYAIKADVYEAVKPVLIDRSATATEVRRLEEALERLQAAQNACENPGPTNLV